MIVLAKPNVKKNPFAAGGGKKKIGLNLVLDEEELPKPKEVRKRPPPPIAPIEEESKDIDMAGNVEEGRFVPPPPLFEDGEDDQENTMQEDEDDALILNKPEINMQRTQEAKPLISATGATTEAIDTSYSSEQSFN
jgi:hypothetical protein